MRGSGRPLGHAASRPVQSSPAAGATAPNGCVACAPLWLSAAAPAQLRGRLRGLACGAVGHSTQRITSAEPDVRPDDVVAADQWPSSAAAAVVGSAAHASHPRPFPAARRHAPPSADWATLHADSYPTLHSPVCIPHPILAAYLLSTLSSPSPFPSLSPPPTPFSPSFPSPSLSLCPLLRCRLCPRPCWSPAPTATSAPLWCSTASSTATTSGAPCARRPRQTGHRVKGLLQAQYGQALSFVVIDDMTKEGAYERAGALDGVDAVCHVASPVPEVADLAPPAPGADVDWVRDMVEPAIQGTLTILRAASKYPQVMHVIVTSSITAIRALAALSDPKAMTTHPHRRRLEHSPQRRPRQSAQRLPRLLCVQDRGRAGRVELRQAGAAALHPRLLLPPRDVRPCGYQTEKTRGFRHSVGCLLPPDEGQPPSLAPRWRRCRRQGRRGSVPLDYREAAERQPALPAMRGGSDRGGAAELHQDTGPFPTAGQVYDTGHQQGEAAAGWKPRTKRETYVDTAAYLQEQDKSMSK